MKHRKLRIAWSVAWGVTSVLLVALWMRSYWWADNIGVHHRNVAPLGHYFLLFSNQGRCACIHVTSGVGSQWISWTTSPIRQPATEAFPFKFSETHGRMGFDAYWLSTTDYGAFIPHWFLVIVSAAFGEVAWLQWPSRFTLRTLLIATTLVAVVLGIVVWAVR